MREDQDALGRAMLDRLESRAGTVLVEREDGRIEPDVPLEVYFAGPRRWPPAEREALRAVRGRVLDVGCGAGRHSLYLQDRGLEVVAIDPGPLVVETARRRGVRDARVMALEQVQEGMGPFDAVVMLGNNLALLGSLRRAPGLLRRLHRVTSGDAVIVGATRDPYATDEPDHLAYHERNRARGRLPGQLRLRLRYRRLAGPWFDYLFVSPDELRGLTEQTGWTVGRTADAGSGLYIALLVKTTVTSAASSRRGSR